MNYQYGKMNKVIDEGGIVHFEDSNNGDGNIGIDLVEPDNK